MNITEIIGQLQEIERKLSAMDTPDGNLESRPRTVYDVKEKKYVQIKPAGPLLTMERNGCLAEGMQAKEDGLPSVKAPFIIFLGSRISKTHTESCPSSAMKTWKQLRDKGRLDEDGYLKEDVLFGSQSGAASFCCQGSANGNDEWRTTDGKKLGELF